MTGTGGRGAGLAFVPKAAVPWQRGNSSKTSRLQPVNQLTQRGPAAPGEKAARRAALGCSAVQSGLLSLLRSERCSGCHPRDTVMGLGADLLSGTKAQALPPPNGHQSAR